MRFSQMCKNILVSAIILIIPPLSAYAVPTSGGKVYVGEITSKYLSANASYNNQTSGTYKVNYFTNPAPPLTIFVQYLTLSYNAFANDVSSKLGSVVNANGGQFSGFSQSGDIIFNVSGDQNRNLFANLGGNLSWGFSTIVSKSVGPLKVTCNSIVQLSNIKSTSTYNPSTGNISGTSLDFNASQGTVCDNTFSWIPFLGDLINEKAASIAGAAIINAANAFSGKVFPIPAQKAIFGFADAIQPNTYMIGSLDIGMYIKNNLPNFFIGKSLTVYLPQPGRYIPQPSLQPGPASITGLVFKMEVIDANTDVSFQVFDTSTYNYTSTRSD